MSTCGKESKIKGNRQCTYDVYVGQVLRNIKQAALLEVFSKYGEVVDVLIRHSANPYGYAIVKFKHKKDANKVLREVPKVCIGDHEMEVKNGKRSNQCTENGEAAISVVKSVSFAEPLSSSQQMGNFHLLNPTLSVKDGNCVGHAVNENSWGPTNTEIMCTNVENVVTFHGCLTSRFEELQNISTTLNCICPNSKPLMRKPALNKIYGALYSEDQRWYRCVVLQCVAPSKSSSCIVEYIDFGNIAEVPYSNMVELHDELRNIDSFAIKCIFIELIPSPKSACNITYLHHLVNSRMSLCGYFSRDHCEYHVIRCICNGIDVISELTRNGYTLPRLQMSFTSLSPNKLDKAHSPKSQENHKLKKISGFHGNKKNSNTCNGSDKYSKELKHEGAHNQAKSYRNSSTESHHTQEFIPKKIIKRESGTCDINHGILEVAGTVNHCLKVDSVISCLKVVNDIRSLVPLHTNNDLVNNAFDLLKSVLEVTTSDDLKQSVEDAYKKYNEALKDIKKCSTQEILLDLKKTKNKCRMELCDELKKFLENFDSTLFEKRKKLQETITALESNSSDWLNVYLPKPSDSIENLQAAFEKEQEKKRNSIEVARKNTNEKHKKFMKCLADLVKELNLNILDGEKCDSFSVSTEGKKGSWALKFNEALEDLGVALEEERVTTVKKDNNKSISSCILEKLDIPKEKIDYECEQYEKYKLLFDDLNYTPDLNSMFDELESLSKTIQAFHSCSENAKNSHEKLLELHSALLRQDNLLMEIGKASSQHFPEFVHEYPELKLENYQKYSGLLKHNWDVNYFPFVENCNRLEPSYISKFANELVVIKEYEYSCESEKDFMNKIIGWNKIKSKSLVKIKGVFKDKDRNVMYAVLSPVSETLYDKLQAAPVDYKLGLNILQQVLGGLCDIHHRGIVHGSVHPMTILSDNGNVILDFNFDKKYLQDKLCLKGINFQVPNAGEVYKSADMYGFGCLVLWVLFSNLSFHSTDEGVPDINPFLSILKEMLFGKDFTSLSALLSVNRDIRPSSRVLLSNGFLKDLRIMSEASS